MKHKNLERLVEKGFRVPKFTVIKNAEEYDETFSDAEFFAVRSSFSSEDHQKASFAGQYDTYLNVPRKDVKDKIRLVLHSHQKEHVKSYKAAQNIHGEEEACVIVQEMIHADCAGVVFTANPLGILNEMVVVVGEGLGDNVVEDKIRTTSYFYNMDDDLYYYDRQEDSCLLQETVLKELLETAKAVKEVYGQNMDIEYAIKNQTIYLLQARPITTFSLKNQIVLDHSNIVESYPGVSLPLTQEFVQEVYYGIFQNCVYRITKSAKLVKEMDEYLKHMTDIANWRIYYRISNWYAVLHLLPFSKRLIPMWQEMLGVTNIAVSLPEQFKISKYTKFTVLKSFFYYLHKTPVLMDRLNKNFERQYQRYRKQIEESKTITELLNIYEYIRQDILKDWDITLVNDMYAFIYTALSGKKNKERIADIKNLESMKPIQSIRNLSGIAQKYGMHSEQYEDAAAKHIEQYGDRCLSELKLETKTYRTNPELLDAYVESQMGTTVKTIPVFKESKNIFVKKAKLGIQNREISRMNRSRLYGMARSIFLKIGTILKNQKRLVSIEDVFYLYIHELNTNSDFIALVEQRKKEALFYQKVPSYSRLVFDGKIINKTGQIEHTEILSKTNMLAGIGTSAGKVTGEVLVMEEPKDTVDTTGKILVTKSTDPGWVFLIQNAIGIIAEKGSLLSHTAIISRELHKPAIVNVKDCTNLLKTGDIVLLDAETGVITIQR